MKTKHKPNPIPAQEKNHACCVIAEVQSRMARQFDRDLEAAAVTYRNVPKVMPAIKAAQDARKWFA